MSENGILAKFHKYIWNTYPKTRWTGYHIPNEAKRTGYAYMIAMGMIVGIPDYHFNFPSGQYRSLYLEFKSEDGKLSEAQKKVHAMLRAHGNRVEVVRSFDEALKTFLEYAEGTEYLQK